MQGFITFILRGRLQAALVTTVAAALTMIVPLFSHVSGGVLSLVTLRNGFLEGLIIALGSLAALAAIGYVSGFSPDVVNFVIGTMFLLMWVPVLITANVLRTTRSIDLTVMVAGGIAGAGLILLYVFVGDAAEWWRGVLGEVMVPILEQMEVQMMGGDSDRIIEAVSRVMTGVLSATLVLTTMTNLLIGRWLQAVVFNPGGFGKEFRSLRLGRPVAILTLVALAIAGFMSGRFADFGLNLSLLLGSMYVLHGLALVHAVVERTGAHVAWLIGLYVMMLFALPQVAMVLASAGFIDSWMDFRARLASRGGPPANRDRDDDPPQ